MLAHLPVYGFSAEAQQIADRTELQKRLLRESAALGNQSAFDELGSVWNECKQPNWDGHHAHAVKRDTLRYAYSLLESLPLDCPIPSIGAEPDGELTLEWHRSPRRTLSVSVTEDGYLHFAGLFGPNRRNGTIAFFGDAPQELLQLISRVFG
jgi:hypothetical protein